MANVSWLELFPTKLSFIIFVLYILLFVNQGLLVTASQESNKEYNYNIVSVVLLTEVLKLIASITLYCKDELPITLVRDIVRHKNVFALYFVPAFLYCLYNNLSFSNLSAFDPTTYYLLLQFRVVVTAVLFQIIFKKTLSKKQWFSLVLLTIGCMLKQFNFTKVDDSTNLKSNIRTIDININALFILVQILCSCLAGVYNEYLLKHTGANVNIYVQNVFMYIDSIICNAMILLIQGNLHGIFAYENLVKLLQFKVLLVMINNAAIGIITSFFLKTLNSILKTFASALEIILTAVLCYLLFNIPIYLNTMLSIVVVLFSVYLYSQNPVTNVPKPQHVNLNNEEEALMEKV